MPIWRQDDELSLVAGCASVWWLDLSGPFGDCPTGVDWTILLPDGVDILDPGHRPHFGTGPDAHRPHVERDGQRLFLSFPGFLPGENHRRPMSEPTSWCDLHWPLVVIASRQADGAEVQIERRAVGDSDERAITLLVHGRADELAVPEQRRCVHLQFWPWFSGEEQAELAATLRRCGFSDCSLNWHGVGIPRLPADAYALTARTLRRVIPGVQVWIGGLPGADTALPRAEALYGQQIPFVASPEAAIHRGPDLVVASERTWCEAVQADGVMIALEEPAAVDTDAMPAHCFSAASRQRFAQELDLPSAPDPIAILQQHREAWVDFCCRQMVRLLQVARLGHGGIPLAVCAYGPGGPARSESSADWQQLAEVADILVYAHAEPPSGSPAEHWGYTRLGGTPQSWWAHWHDPMGTIPDRRLAAADARMQLALSGGLGVRIGGWASLDGAIQAQLMEWR
ncbi:MAG: hypothetical protein PF961_05750 [Planctomycetota bacterium]|nr:hypothetical protein [Planctomycetota bacterium]